MSHQVVPQGVVGNGNAFFIEVAETRVRLFALKRVRLPRAGPLSVRR
jgi:hypothetical protein